MRLPRITVRRMMVAVAIVALILGGRRTWHHYRDCRSAAILYRTLEESQRTNCKLLEEMLNEHGKFLEKMRKIKTFSSVELETPNEKLEDLYHTDFIEYNQYYKQYNYK